MAIDLRKFRHVVETARLENVTHAAEALNITQSALTRSIAEVEAEMNAQLFIRSQRGVRLTEVGRRFVERAQRIVADADELLAGIRDQQFLRSGRLRIGVVPAVYQHFISRPIAEMAARHPSLAIEILPGAAETMAPRLTAGDVDIIFGHIGQMQRWPDLVVEQLSVFHHAAIVRHGHPISKLKKAREVDLLRYPLVLPTTLEPVQSAFSEIYAKANLPPPNPLYSCDDFGIVSALIRRTDAFTPVVSPTPSFDHLAKDFLVLRDVMRLPDQRLGLAVSRTQPPAPAVEELRTLFLENLAG